MIREPWIYKISFFSFLSVFLPFWSSFQRFANNLLESPQSVVHAYFDQSERRQFSTFFLLQNFIWIWRERKARQEKNRKQFRKFLIVYLFRINPLFVHCTGTNEQHVRNVYLPFPFCITASWFPSLLFQFQSSSGVKYIRCFVQRTKKGSKKILFFIYKEQKHYKKQ